MVQQNVQNNFNNNQSYKTPQQNYRPQNNSPSNTHGHSEQSFGQKDTLETVFNYSFAGAHALTFSLVKKMNPPQPSQKQDYKEKLFFFVTIAPGITSGTERTYDFKTGRITQKFSVREIIALSKTLKYCCEGHEDLVLPYVKFTKNDNMSKSFTIWMSKKTQSVNNQNVDVRLINFTIYSGQIRHTLNLSIADALGLYDYLYKICTKAFELEFEIQNSGASIKNPTKLIQNQNMPMQISNYPINTNPNHSF